MTDTMLMNQETHGSDLARELAEAKVTELGDIVRRKDNVLRLHVAVDEAMRVDTLQSSCLQGSNPRKET